MPPVLLNVKRSAASEGFPVWGALKRLLSYWKEDRDDNG
jgi:hypothetical protein